MATDRVEVEAGTFLPVTKMAEFETEQPRYVVLGSIAESLIPVSLLGHPHAVSRGALKTISQILYSREGTVY